MDVVGADFRWEAPLQLSATASGDWLFLDKPWPAPSGSGHLPLSLDWRWHFLKLSAACGVKQGEYRGKHGFLDELDIGLRVYLKRLGDDSGPFRVLSSYFCGKPGLRVLHLHARQLRVEVLNVLLVHGFHRPRQHILAEVGNIGNRRLALRPVLTPPVVVPGEQHLGVLIAHTPRVVRVALGAEHLQQLVYGSVFLYRPVGCNVDIAHGDFVHLTGWVAGRLQERIWKVRLDDVRCHVSVEVVVPHDVLGISGEVVRERLAIDEGQLLRELVKAKALVHAKLIALLASVELTGGGDCPRVHEGIGRVENLPLRPRCREPLGKLAVSQVGVEEVGSRPLREAEGRLFLLYRGLRRLDSRRQVFRPRNLRPLLHLFKLPALLRGEDAPLVLHIAKGVLSGVGEQGHGMRVVLVGANLLHPVWKEIIKVFLTLKGWPLGLVDECVELVCGRNPAGLLIVGTRNCYCTVLGVIDWYRALNGRALGLIFLLLLFLGTVVCRCLS